MSNKNWEVVSKPKWEAEVTFHEVIIKFCIIYRLISLGVFVFVFKSIPDIQNLKNDWLVLVSYLEMQCLSSVDEHAGHSSLVDFDWFRNYKS